MREKKKNYLLGSRKSHQAVGAVAVEAISRTPEDFGFSGVVGEGSPVHVYQAPKFEDYGKAVVIEFKH